MRKNFRKLACLLAALVVVMGTASASFAAEPMGQVTFRGEAESFLFEPGSDYSLTDLFGPEQFKGVMPGDVIEDNITVRNEESNDYKVEIFMRATGATALENEDPEKSVDFEKSAKFLNQMTLTVVEQVEGYEDDELFNEKADQTGGLTEWTSLGVFDSGAEVNLNVKLEVPVEMGDEFQNAIGALNWEFKAQAYEIRDEADGNTLPSGEEEPSDEPDKNKDKGTQTGDDSNMIVPLSLMGVAALAIILALATRRKKQTEE